MKPTETFVIGLSIFPASDCINNLRLEEVVYQNSREALRNAKVSRRELDSIVLASSDEYDGRSISSMLLAMPAGAYLKDEIKVSDTGAMAIALAMARLQSGNFHLSLAASWCKSSKTDHEAFKRTMFEPVFTRPLGLNGPVTDGLFANAVADRWNFGIDEIDLRVARAHERASRNPRGVARSSRPSQQDVARSGWVSTPLRTDHYARPTDGAVALVLASGDWVRRNPQARPLAKLSGVGWSIDRSTLDAERLSAMNSATSAMNTALAGAGMQSAAEADVIEIEAQNGFYEAAFARAFDIDGHNGLSPSGGAFAQNPVFSTSLLNMAEAVLQVSDRAGPVQIDGAKRAIGHGCYGFGQQGNVAAVFERVGGAV